MADIPLRIEIPSAMRAKQIFLQSAMNTKAYIEDILMLPAPLSPRQFEHFADYVEKYYDPRVVSLRRKSGIDDSFSFGFTLATLAISKNHINVDMLELFHRVGADLKGEDGYSKTPHQWLIEKGYPKEAAMLRTLLTWESSVAIKPLEKQDDYANALYIIDIAG